MLKLNKTTAKKLQMLSRLYRLKPIAIVEELITETYKQEIELPARQTLTEKK